MRLKILVFIDHQIVARHFIDSGAFEALAEAHDVSFVLPPPNHKRIAGTDLSALHSSRVVNLEECILRTSIWKRIFQIDTLRNRSGNQARALSDHHRWAIGKKANFLYQIFGLPVVWHIYRRYLLWRVRKEKNAALEALIDREKPNAILHPTVLSGPYIDDLIDVGSTRRIPVVGIMNSWDNPSTKRSVVGQLDWLLVWGQQTRDHAIRYIGMSPQRIVRFGAAQLDLYREKPRRTPQEMRLLHSVPSGARVLLYAGSSKGSDEFGHLDRLEQAIEDGILANLIVVYRPHPWGDCGKDGARIAAKDWKHVRFDSSMRDYITRAKGGPQPISTPDYRDTYDILAAADVVVSPVSTILLEAALIGIPNICLIDDVEEKNWHLEVSTRLEHLREFFATPEFKIAKSLAGLVSSVQEALRSRADPETADRLRNAARYFIDVFERPYSERLRSFVEEIFAEPKPHLGVSYFVEDARPRVPYESDRIPGSAKV